MRSFPTIVRAALGLGLAFLGLVFLGLAFLVAAASAPPGADGASDGLYDGMPDVEIDYYDISGRTVAQIRASARRVAPIDPLSGLRAGGYTRWHLDWDAPGGPDGRCRLDQAEVTLDVAITLPRLTKTHEVPPALLQRWQRYIRALKAHEATHARIAHEGREAMLRAIQRADCASAPEAAREAAAELERWSQDYDRATRHGVTEGVHFP